VYKASAVFSATVYDLYSEAYEDKTSIMSTLASVFATTI